MILSPAEKGNSVPAKDFLQSQFWADFKSNFGWSNLRLRVQDEGLASYELSVLIRKLVGPFSFAYIPHGPEVECDPATRQTHMVALAEALESRLPDYCLFLRFDPAWFSVNPDNATPIRLEFSSPLVKASDVQPPDTVVLDLTCTEAELLARMKPKWRYNIKLAEKKDVLVTEESSTSLDIFYNLYQQTAARDHIAVHPKSYYDKLFELAAFSKSSDKLRASTDSTSFQSSRNEQNHFKEKPEFPKREPCPDLRLWVARHEDQAVACIVTLFYGQTATYLYGASSDEKRNLMPAYALQWAAIKAAKAADCLEYDMYGIPPTQDEQHPMAGLYRFKTGFGGEIRHYPGTWDYIYLPLWYSLFRTVEQLRLLWYKKFKKNR